MAINFPNSPVNGSTYEHAGIRYTYVVTGATGYWKVLTPGTTGTATSAEIDAGTDGVKYIAPASLEGSKYEAGLHADGVSYDNSDGGLEATVANLQETIAAILDERPNPNYIINGEFQVWQRGNNFTDFSFGGQGDYCADRWTNRNGTADITRTNDGPTGFSRCAEIVSKTGDYAQLRTPVELDLYGTEGQFVIGSTWTLSWYARSDTHTTTCGAHMNWGNGSGSEGRADGSTDIPTVGTLSSSWKRFTYTFTITAPATANTNSIFPLIYLNSAPQTGVEGFITGVKLEKGSIATRFENEPYGDVLAKCRRYYQNGRTSFQYSNTLDPLYIEATVQFAVQMRVSPIGAGNGIRVTSGQGNENTASRIGSSNTSEGNISLAQSDGAAGNASGFYRMATSGGLVNNRKYFFVWFADAELET